MYYYHLVLHGLGPISIVSRVRGWKSLDAFDFAVQLCDDLADNEPKRGSVLPVRSAVFLLQPAAAMHIAFGMFKQSGLVGRRGLMLGVATRMHFGGDPR